MSTKEDIILVGGGGHCKSCIDVIESEGRYIIKGIIDIPKKIGQRILGYPIINSDDNLDKVVSSYKNFLITLGFIKSPLLRINLFSKIKELGGRFPVVISSKAHVSGYAKIDEGTIVMHGSIINAEAHIGKNCIINNLSLIEHDAKIGEQTHISTGARVNGNCIVGENCFIGSGVIINHGISVCRDVIIGSGSVVRKNIIEPWVYVGNPLRKVKQ
jgi:sugar O-acyltransferase (sialic acid O-acetyltransferase NeuD family)